MRFLKIAFILFACCSWASAQRFISLGMKGGVPFTASFSDQNFTPNPILPYVGSIYGVNSYSNSNGYVIGPAVELHLPINFSVEVDALFRPLSITKQYYVIGPGPEPPVSTNYRSWEFPVLAKYRVSAPFIKPFVEAGPAFRAAASAISSSLSKAGVTGGIGIEVKLWHIRIDPQVRFTHWGKDSGSAALQYLASERNQGEFLVGLFF
jgi:hypothetical protein